MMFQNPDDQIIFPTVAEELALGLQPQGLKKREALQQARSFLAERGLEGWADRAISTLSQGQRQHVCWLSLLLAGPATLLLDEPYASLDLPGQARLFHDLAHTDRQLIVSTHLLDHVRTYPRVLWPLSKKLKPALSAANARALPPAVLPASNTVTSAFPARLTAADKPLQPAPITAIFRFTLMV